MKSISKRLTLRIMMVVLTMMAVIAGVVYLTEAEQRFQIVVTRAYGEVQRRLSEVFVANVNNVHEIERDIDDPDRLYDHLERIVRQNPYIVSCGLLFVPDYYPEKGRYFVPFATADTADVVSVMRIDSLYHDYNEEDWFVERLESDSADWVDPYFENPLLTTHLAPRLLVTHSIPIHNREGRPVAVLCSNLSLEDMRDDMLQKVRQGKRNYEQNEKHPSYNCIIDRNGRYVLHPDRDRMLKDTLDAKVTFKGKEGTVSAIVDGVPSWIFYRHLNYVAVLSPADQKGDITPPPLRPFGRRGGERQLQYAAARHQGRRRDTPVARLVRQHAAVAQPLYRRTEDDHGPEVGHRERAVGGPQDTDVDADDRHAGAPGSGG